MGQRNIIIIAVAVLLGLVAVFLANTWFSSVQTRQERSAAQSQLVRIAVAQQPVEFGTALTSNNVRMTLWPANSVPAGAFRDESKLVSTGRVAIRPIAVGEPILASRISDRAVLSANLPNGMRAVSISVTPVSGVSGFVTPGDVVDVMLTHSPASGNGEQVTSVLLENVHVLGVDRRSSNKDTKAALAKTVTLEVDQVDAQKLVLASQMGTLSLALRNVENQLTGPTKVVTARDLGGGVRYVAPRSRQAAYVPPSSGTAMVLPKPPSGPKMTVFRGTSPSDYEVKRYGQN